MRFVVPTVYAVLLAVSVRPADACVPPDDEISDHELDPAHASDSTPPATPTADFTIARNETDSGCLSKSDCDGKSADIYINVDGTDDATPTDRLGYILTITGGDKPHGMYSRFQDGMPVFQPRGELSYGFDYDDEDFAFDLEIRTVDLNGNVSEPTVLHIEEHAPGGCSTSAQRTEWLLLPVLAFALRRRRRC
jgi:hypothetical protein